MAAAAAPLPELMLLPSDILLWVCVGIEVHGLGNSGMFANFVVGLESIASDMPIFCLWYQYSVNRISIIGISLNIAYNGSASFQYIGRGYQYDS